MRQCHWLTATRLLRVTDPAKQTRKSYSLGDLCLMRHTLIELGYDCATKTWSGCTWSKASGKLKVNRKTLRRAAALSPQLISQHDPNLKRLRVGKLKKVEEEVYAWVQELLALGAPVPASFILARANVLQRRDNADAVDLTWQWYKGFRRRHNISRSRKLHGQAGECDLSDPAVVARVKEIREIAKAYGLDEIWNCGE